MTTQHDIPDLIAGALGVSRGTAYDLMREALAEQAQPYGWKVYGVSGLFVGEYAEQDAKAEAERIGGTCIAFPLYTAPPAERKLEESLAPRQPWIGLTDEEINAAASVQSWKPFARAIEAKLKEKNT